MIHVTLPEAERRLDELIRAAEAGEEVVVTRNDKPAVRLLALPVSVRPRPPVTGVPRAGTCEGVFVVPDDFKEPLEEMREYME